MTIQKTSERIQTTLSPPKTPVTQSLCFRAWVKRWQCWEEAFPMCVLIRLPTGHQIDGAAPETGDGTIWTNSVWTGLFSLFPFLRPQPSSTTAAPLISYTILLANTERSQQLAFTKIGFYMQFKFYLIQDINCPKLASDSSNAVISIQLLDFQ